jgi:hypothetical protein
LNRPQPPAFRLQFCASSPIRSIRALPDLNRALDATGGLDGRKALRVALGSPVRTAKLLAANKRAMQHLTKALEVVLKAPCFTSSASL